MGLQFFFLSLFPNCSLINIQVELSQLTISHCTQHTRNTVTKSFCNGRTKQPRMLEKRRYNLVHGSWDTVGVCSGLLAQY
ncbi:hypothetical protein BDV34DRAFT_198643 [Aspergillus parasiticus]|uniref:Secreted protein n=1 Tax=Aspergillus parasiticus TaxID=5067 RepID=A0A5N6DFF9_ASPPA|nr:hypothetical protein BDV34DRAFT_198643 [Aspergillus parasiticus]